MNWFWIFSDKFITNYALIGFSAVFIFNESLASHTLNASERVREKSPPKWQMKRNKNALEKIMCE